MTKSMLPEWWREGKVMGHATGETWLEVLVNMHFYDRAACLGVPVEERSFRRNNKDAFDRSAFDRALAELDLRPIYRWHDGGERRILSYMSSEAACHLSTNARAVTTVLYTIGDGEPLARKLLSVLEMFFLPEHQERPKDTGAVHMLVVDHGSYEFNRTRAVGLPLCRENYAPDVLKHYDYVAEHLPAKKPPGRLAIFEGPPGTGKTHVVMALLCQLRDTCAFVLVPPSALSDLTSPHLLPPLETFIERQRRMTRKVVFIIEDADECLLPRGVDNMGTIATLLNMADGILGAVLDVRIVATTNAKKVQVDEAILRDGRLLARTEVGPLTHEQALACYAHHAGSSTRDDAFRGAKRPVLAQVYRQLFLDGWKAPDPPGVATEDDDDDDDEIPRRATRKRVRH